MSPRGTRSLTGAFGALEISDWPMMEAEFGFITKKSQSLTELANAFIDELFDIVSTLKS